MELLETVNNPAGRVLPVIDAVMRGIGRLDEGLEPRLSDHVEPPDFGRMFGNRDMLVRQIVDKNRHAGGIVCNDPRERLALAALVGDDREVDPDGAQLFGAGGLEIVGQVGQDHDVGLGANRIHCLHCAVDRALARHFAPEEILEQGPDIGAGNQFAGRLVAQGIGKIAQIEVEMDVMRLVEPFGEGHDHVKQYFVAIGDQQRAAHEWGSGRASCAGGTPSASAQAIRSG